MKIWGISDFHLSFSTDKPMDIFGDHWQDHAQKMAESWDRLVQPEDVVLCPGDLSWAMRLENADKDLAWIGARPGLKILGKGNHDYWWQSISKVRKMLPPTCVALQNDAYELEDAVVAGSRLWTTPGSYDFTDQDQKIYEREIGRLELSLQAARKLSKTKMLIAAIHYPPFTSRGDETDFTKLLEKYGVSICVYGHLHGESSHKTAIQGEHHGVDYHLIACDFLNFVPKQIWPRP